MKLSCPICESTPDVHRRGSLYRYECACGACAPERPTEEEAAATWEALVDGARIDREQLEWTIKLLDVRTREVERLGAEYAELRALLEGLRPHLRRLYRQEQPLVVWYHKLCELLGD